MGDQDQYAGARALVEARDAEEQAPEIDQYMIPQAHGEAPPQDPYAVARNAPPGANLGGSGAQVLDPLPQQQPVQQNPQYTLQTVPVGTTTTSTSSGLDAQTIKALDKDRNAQIQAYAAEREAMAPQIARDAVAAKREAELAKTRAEDSAKYAIDSANTRDEIARNNGAARAKMQADVDDYLKQGDKVDSNRVWHRMDTGQKVGYAIAAAMAGFGEALRGRGGNPVIEMLSAAEERDMRAQEMSLNAKARGISMRDSLYGHLVAEGHDKELARAADLNAKNQAIADQLAAAQADAKTASQAEMAAKNSADWQVKMASDQMAYDQLTARHTTSSTVTQKQAVLMDANGNPVGKGQEGKADPQSFLQDVRRMQQSGAIRVDDGQALVDAVKFGRMPPRVYEQLQAAERLHGLRQDYINGINKYHDSDVNSAEADKWKNYVIGLRNDIKGQASIAKGSALSPEEARHIDDQLPEPERKIPRLGSSGFKTAREQEIAGANGMIDSLVTPINGNLKPFGLSVPDSSGSAGRGDPVKQVRSSDGKVYNFYADGSISRQ